MPLRAATQTLAGRAAELAAVGRASSGDAAGVMQSPGQTDNPFTGVVIATYQPASLALTGPFDSTTDA